MALALRAVYQEPSSSWLSVTVLLFSKSPAHAAYLAHERSPGTPVSVFGFPGSNP